MKIIEIKGKIKIGKIAWEIGDRYSNKRKEIYGNMDSIEKYE